MIERVSIHWPTTLEEWNVRAVESRATEARWPNKLDLRTFQNSSLLSSLPRNRFVPKSCGLPSIISPLLISAKTGTAHHIADSKLQANYPKRLCEWCQEALQMWADIRRRALWDSIPEMFVLRVQ
ncbi:hypothetical protein C8Q77DRAFT_1255971 [Trametes polyzona]|nr:hypothetical protein C8Q77DRAFT_1255971 [Trametes polyzona]